MPDSLVKPLVIIGLVLAITTMICAAIGIDGTIITDWLGNTIGHAIGNVAEAIGSTVGNIWDTFWDWITFWN